MTEFSAFPKLKTLDISDNEFSGSMELQGKSAQFSFTFPLRVVANSRLFE